jgi:hypothetical protein
MVINIKKLVVFSILISSFSGIFGCRLVVFNEDKDMAKLSVPGYKGDWEIEGSGNQVSGIDIVKPGNFIYFKDLPIDENWSSGKGVVFLRLLPNACEAFIGKPNGGDLVVSIYKYEKGRSIRVPAPSVSKDWLHDPAEALGQKFKESKESFFGGRAFVLEKDKEEVVVKDALKTNKSVEMAVADFIRSRNLFKEFNDFGLVLKEIEKNNLLLQDQLKGKDISKISEFISALKNNIAFEIKEAGSLYEHLRVQFKKLEEVLRKDIKTEKEANESFKKEVGEALKK